MSGTAIIPPTASPATQLIKVMVNLVQLLAAAFVSPRLLIVCASRTELSKNGSCATMQRLHETSALAPWRWDKHKPNYRQPPAQA
jgi:hypothetical protein